MTRRSFLSQAGLLAFSGPLRDTQASAAAVQAPSTDLSQALKAIWFVESSCSLNPPDGDHGKAIGPFQVHCAYWQDACRIMHVQWPYEQARQYSRAEKAVCAYLTHYQALFASKNQALQQSAAKLSISLTEQFCRIHNGGPRACEASRAHKTDKYWSKCLSFLNNHNG
jgi:hypothetical protein